MQKKSFWHYGAIYIWSFMKNLCLEGALWCPRRLCTSFVALFLLVLPSLLFGYKTIHRLEEMAEEMADLNQESLVIFDVDNVLIAAESAINRAIGDSYRDTLKRHYFDGLSEQTRNELESIVWQEGKFRLTEEEIPSVIQLLQRRNIPTIALTSLGTGRFGNIADLTEYRINQLKGFRIDLSLSAPKAQIVFDQLKLVYGSYPVYREGILFTNWYGNSKGSVLAAFLAKINRKPKRVLFFDDSISNLNSVQEELSTLGIEFVGIHYQTERLLQDRLDLSLAELQFKSLCDRKRWVDDGDAKGELQEEINWRPLWLKHRL